VATKKKETPPVVPTIDVIDALQKKISFLETKLDAENNKKRVDPDAVEALTSRIAELEAKINEAEDKKTITLPGGVTVQVPEPIDPPSAKPARAAVKEKKSNNDEGGFMF
jgi:hypothetical protein